MSKENDDAAYQQTPASLHNKAIPLRMVTGPLEYVPGRQEEPVALTTVAEMLNWAMNWARSRSVWPPGLWLGLLCDRNDCICLGPPI